MELQFADRCSLSLDRPRIVGVLNITPDSFSDGGRWVDLDAAVAHGLAMAAAGADLIDVGGESTRPGAARVDAAEQCRRVIEPIRRLRAALDEQFPAVQISIDTTLSQVAQPALDAGATMLNDISAGREDPSLLALAASRRVPIVLMHMLGEPATMQHQPVYDDVVRQVRDFLLERARAAQAAGVPSGQIVLDVGIGFGKTVEHNLQLLAHLADFAALGYPLMLGTSRKSFLARLSPPGSQASDDPAQRVGGTCATTALGVLAGAHLFRVHDVAPNRQAADVAHAIRQRITPAPSQK